MTTDPRGPIVKVVAIKELTTHTSIIKSCGHTGSHAQHFTYHVGEDIRCFKCGPLAEKMK